MEQQTNIQEINFLQNPQIDPKKLKYINNTKKVYANLYEIFLTKVLKLYQYPFKVIPEIEAGDTNIRKNIIIYFFIKFKNFF